ncbi:MAG: lipopolysaccharide biosynthesis protein [Planctomycetota bacterium]
MAIVRFITRLTSKRCSAALLDQFFVSGTSLLTTILVGRYCGADGLGLFSLAISVVVMVRGFQETLVSSPYTVFRSRVADRMALEEHAAGALAGAALLGSIVVCVLVMAATICSFTPSLQSISPLAWTLALAAPLALAREFARRFEMASLNMSSAMRIDAGICFLQTGLILALALQGQLNSVTAVLIVGVASGLMTAIWVFQRRKAFSFRRDTVISTIRHDWGFGRWLIADQMLRFAQVYSMPWLLAGMLGTSATGVFAACVSIAGLASPLLQGTGNYLAPRFAESIYDGSRHETMQLYWRATASLGITISLLAIVAAMFAEQLLWLLYDDPAYRGYGAVVGILAFRTACAIPAIAAHHAVVAMERPRRSAAATMIGLVVTVLTALPLIPLYGVWGAAIASLLGTGCECFALVTFFAHSLRGWAWTDLCDVSPEGTR